MIPREFSCREQSQGPAVDMWSLGIVTLLLLAPYADSDYADLNSMEQQELEVCLKNHYFNENSECSAEAQKFVWQCLRVQAAARLTAQEAARQDWLNSSEAHIRFFEKVDNKVHASWEIRAELNAMPWEIPCVLSRLEARDTDTKDSDRSSYFAATEVTPASTPEHNNTPSLEKTTAALNTESAIFQKPALPVRSSPNPLSDAWAITLTTQKSYLKYGERARRRQSKRKRMSELNLSPDLRIHEGMHLPLNNLDRHLPPTPNTKKRRQVLEELKQSKSLFLEE
jgi:serine/threonine protein kinase